MNRLYGSWYPYLLGFDDGDVSSPQLRREPGRRGTSSGTTSDHHQFETEDKFFLTLNDDDWNVILLKLVYDRYKNRQIRYADITADYLILSDLQ